MSFNSTPATTLANKLAALLLLRIGRRHAGRQAGAHAAAAATASVLRPRETRIPSSSTAVALARTGTGSRSRGALFVRVALAAPAPHRTRPHDAVRTPGSDSVVMHVAGQFDPRAMGPPPRRFTGRHMLRSPIAVEHGSSSGLAEGIATPAGLMPRPRSTIPLPFQSRCQPIPSSLRSNESQLIFMQTKGVDRSHSHHKRERQSACEAQPPTHHTPPLDLTFAHTFLDRTQCV
jgi:hypothetical protein